MRRPPINPKHSPFASARNFYLMVIWMAASFAAALALYGFIYLIARGLATYTNEVIP